MVGISTEREQPQSVKDLFGQECPRLVGSLDQTGGFWPRVADNTILSSELADHIGYALQTSDIMLSGSCTEEAALRLLLSRAKGILPTPPEPENPKK